MSEHGSVKSQREFDAWFESHYGKEPQFDGLTGIHNLTREVETRKQALIIAQTWLRDAEDWICQREAAIKAWDANE